MVEEKPLFSVAPMMQYTDRHQRAFQRIMSKKTILYTEMVTTSALIHSDKTDRFLRADLPVEEPVVLQLGGSNPEHMKEASKLAHKYGYNEINLNIGCPSEKVSGAGCFGAVLFLNPPLVSELALAVGEATGKPATVKCRIGVDGHETYEELHSFIRTVSEVGKVTHFIIHARIAVLGKRLSPKDNRTIPPLKYDVVYQLIRDFPHLCFSLNGGVDNMELVSELLQREGGGLHGVMVGRAVVNNPYAWSTVDSTLYGIKDPGLSRLEVLQQYIAYTAREEQRDDDPRSARVLVNPVTNLFHSLPRGKLFRRTLNECLAAKMSATEVLLRAAECVTVNDNSYGDLEQADTIAVGDRKVFDSI